MRAEQGQKSFGYLFWLLIRAVPGNSTGGGTTKPAGKKKGKKEWKVSEANPLHNGHSSNLEDGAVPLCHVSVRRRNADTPPQNQSYNCGLAVDLPAFTLRHRGWTLFSHRSNHFVKSGKCGDGADQLHGGYSCRILCIVVRTLCCLFSGLQKPGKRY